MATPPILVPVAPPPSPSDDADDRALLAAFRDRHDREALQLGAVLQP